MSTVKLDRELARVEALGRRGEPARANSNNTAAPDLDGAVRAARAVVASSSANSTNNANNAANNNNDELEREAHMLLGRALIASGDRDGAVAELRTRAKLPGKAPRRDAELSKRAARTRILALRALAALSVDAGDVATARLAFARLLATATACAGSVAQMAALDSAVQPALEEALFDAPSLAAAPADAASASSVVVADADLDAVHALRCALAAPMRLSRRAAAQRVRLLQLLAHRLLTAHSAAAYVRCDSAALVAVVGASAATARRVVPRDVVDEVCVLLRLALAERLPSDVPPAQRAADSLADNLCLALARRAAFANAVADLELELSNSPSDSHTQLQFALALAAGGFAARAVDRLRLWLDEFAGVDAAPTIDTVSLHLLVAKLLLNDLGAVAEANAEARVALQHAEQRRAAEPLVVAAAAHAVGVTSAARARAEQVGSRRQRLESDARAALRRAAALNPVSGDVAFALALAHADVRAVTPALELARAAVALRADAASWNLLALLLSSRRRFKRALAATKAGLKLGDDVELLRTQAQLQHALDDTPGAMRSLMRAFAVYRQQRVLQFEQERRGAGTGTLSGSEPSVLSARTFEDARGSDVRSTGAPRSVASRSVLGLPAPSTPSTASVIHAPAGTAASVAGGGGGGGGGGGAAAGAAAAGAAGGNGGAGGDGERPPVGYGDRELWQDVGALFCAVQQWDEAAACLAEMAKLAPLAADVMSFEASLAQARGRGDEAEQLYEKLLSLHPTHAASLRDSGVLLLEREEARLKQHRAAAVADARAHSIGNAQLLLAEQRLQQAARLDAMNHATWQGLGRVLLAKGEHERAAECFFTQIELEHTAPVRPFSAVAYAL